MGLLEERQRGEAVPALSKLAGGGQLRIDRALLLLKY